MKDRGCETTKKKGDEGQPSWGFEYDVTTWPKRRPWRPRPQPVRHHVQSDRREQVQRCLGDGKPTTRLRACMLGRTARKRGSASDRKNIASRKSKIISALGGRPWTSPALRGKNWSEFMGIGGKCSKDSDCCSGNCKLTDFDDACWRVCHSDGVHCRGKNVKQEQRKGNERAIFNIAGGRVGGQRRRVWRHQQQLRCNKIGGSHEDGERAISNIAGGRVGSTAPRVASSTTIALQQNRW